MKRIAIILIAITAALVSCSKTEVWLDHDDPVVYLSRPGVTFNKAWMVESEEYTTELGVYLGGVRPSNQESNIKVSFEIDPSLINSYNEDVSQQYAGQVMLLPADCYEITDNSVTIPEGSVSAVIPIKIFTSRVEALGMGADDIYVVPVRLMSTTKYRLSENEEQLESLYGITLDEPMFYFWVNRDAVSSPFEISKKVIYGEEPRIENYMITSSGTNLEESYTITVEVDPSMVPSGGELLPSDAYELPQTSIVMPVGEVMTNLPVKIVNNNVAFRQNYYLPIRITAVSKYSGDPVKGILLLKVDVKNDYEWTYVSKVTIASQATGRSASNQLTKAPTSWDENTLVLTNGYYREHLGTGAWISYGQSYKLRVIPTSDINRWDVEVILDADTTVPDSFELDPDKESYYDWDNETFYLYYRWLHYGSYVYVTEFLEAQF